MFKLGDGQTAHLRIVDTGTALGRGVFAPRDFSSGEIVEAAPVILLKELFRNLPLLVQRVVFNWGRGHDSKPIFALVLGCGSLYNHSDHPNLRYRADHSGQTMIFTATRDINHGEQLTVSYDQVAEGAPPRKESWFTRNHIEKLELDGLEAII